MAKELGAVGFIPYSARTQQNLRFLFEECIKTALCGGPPDQEKSERGSGCVLS
jgi:hypothetical protein